MQKSAQGAFATNTTTLEAVADDLKLLLLTNHGERPIQSDYGANLRSVIFDVVGEDLRQVVEDLVRSAIEKWMPFVNVLKIEIEDSSTDLTARVNEVIIKLEFSVGNIDSSKILVQRITS